MQCFLPASFLGVRVLVCFFYNSNISDVLLTSQSLHPHICSKNVIKTIWNKHKFTLRNPILKINIELNIELLFRNIFDVAMSKFVVRESPTDCSSASASRVSLNTRMHYAWLVVLTSRTTTATSPWRWRPRLDRLRHTLRERARKRNRGALLFM